MRLVRGADNPTTFVCRLSWNVGASTSWNLRGPCRDCFSLALHLQWCGTSGCLLLLKCVESLNILFYGCVCVFTFMWPCIVTNIFLIKPTRRTNFPNFILSKNSTCFRHFLCPSSSKQGQDGTSWPCLEAVIKIYQCRMYSRKLLMMGKGNARNM